MEYEDLLGFLNYVFAAFGSGSIGPGAPAVGASTSREIHKVTAVQTALITAILDAHRPVTSIFKDARRQHL